jgi:hypothetical protein
MFCGPASLRAVPDERFGSAAEKPLEIRTRGKTSRRKRGREGIAGDRKSGCADLKRAIPAVMDGNDIIIAEHPWLGGAGTRMSLSVAAIEADGMEKEVPEGVRIASIASLGAAIEDPVAAHSARRTPARG